MRNLIENSDLGIKATSTIGRTLLHLVKSYAGVDGLNTLYKSVVTKNRGKNDFAARVIDELSIEIDSSDSKLEATLSKMKVSGGVIVCNFPHGAIDALGVLSIMQKMGPKVALLAPRIFKEIPELADNILTLDENSRQRISDIRAIKRFISEGGKLIVFASTGITSNGKTGEIEWNDGLLKTIMSLKTSVIPLYIEGHNSLIYRGIRSINERLGVIRLVRELLNKQGYTLGIMGGDRIDKNIIASLKNADELAILLNSMFSLYSEIEKDKLIEKSEEVTVSNDDERIAELSSDFSKKNYNLLLENQNWEVWSKKNYATTITLLGVDRESGVVCAATTVNICDKMIEELGFESLALYKNFEYSHKIQPYLKQTIEVAENFVAEKYKERNTLNYAMCEAVYKIMTTNEDYKILVSEVDISDSQSIVSQKISVNLVKNYFYTKSYRKYIRPRRKIRNSSLPFFHKSAMDVVGRRDILSLFGRCVEENSKKRIINAEIKKYVQLGGKVVRMYEKVDGNKTSIKGLMLIRK